MDKITSYKYNEYNCKKIKIKNIIIKIIIKIQNQINLKKQKILNKHLGTEIKK